MNVRSEASVLIGVHSTPGYTVTSIIAVTKLSKQRKRIKNQYSERLALPEKVAYFIQQVLTASEKFIAKYYPSHRNLPSEIMEQARKHLVDYSYCECFVKELSVGPPCSCVATTAPGEEPAASDRAVYLPQSTFFSVFNCLCKE